jgi:hypothetical protein
VRDKNKKLIVCHALYSRNKKLSLNDVALCGYEGEFSRNVNELGPVFSTVPSRIVHSKGSIIPKLDE